MLATITCFVLALSACGGPAVQQTTGADTSRVRRELEAWYRQNADAFRSHDVAAVMALRAADFRTITPDGRTQDRATMELYTVGLLNGVKKWNVMEFSIDSLRVAGDTAFVIVSQHLDRMALRPDNLVHHVQTWATQRETLVRTQDRWLLWRVDGVRNQRRLVDGRPG
jgi:ketosteroid isomerase-like protein